MKVPLSERNFTIVDNNLLETKNNWILGINTDRILMRLHTLKNSAESRAIRRNETEKDSASVHGDPSKVSTDCGILAETRNEVELDDMVSDVYNGILTKMILTQFRSQVRGSK